MKKLSLALYSEGSTDQHFLPDVIRRTSRQILARYGQASLSTLYSLLGREINLERLQQVPSYQQFESDLTDTLKKLSLLP
jgi:hypothetical protein